MNTEIIPAPEPEPQPDPGPPPQFDPARIRCFAGPCKACKCDVLYIAKGLGQCVMDVHYVHHGGYMVVNPHACPRR